MINAGKCPKCEKVVRAVRVERVDITAGPAGPTWVGASYVCQSCQTVLSVAIDAVALKADLLKEIRKLLKATS